MTVAAPFTIGTVKGVHGLRGLLRVASFAASMDTFAPGRTVFLREQGKDDRFYQILDVSPHKQGLLLALEGIDSRDLAEDLVGSDILIHRDQLPEPEADSWFWEDLMGLAVRDHTKGYLGTITHIFPTGANDVLVVTDGDRETLVPMHRHFVQSVDLENRTLLTTLPEDY